MNPGYQRIVFGRIIYIGIIIVLIVLGGIFIIRVKNLSVELRKARHENALLLQDKTFLTRELAMARAWAADLEKTMPDLSEKAKAEYRRRGLTSPHDDIISDLGSREELMPFRGVFGARPSFYTEVRMYVLNARWAFASFNDGHNIGDRLYSYRVSDDGKISWSILDTFMREVSGSGVPTE